jgi:hypothetical protein
VCAEIVRGLDIPQQRVVFVEVVRSPYRSIVHRAKYSSAQLHRAARRRRGELLDLPPETSSYKVIIRAADYQILRKRKAPIGSRILSTSLHTLSVRAVQLVVHHAGVITRVLLKALFATRLLAGSFEKRSVLAVLQVRFAGHHTFFVRGYCILTTNARQDF